MTSPSCRDMTSENSYHMLMLGLLFGVPGYGDPRSNREEGRGYFDIQLAPECLRPGDGSASLPVITLEFKVLPTSEVPADATTREARLRELAKTGLSQIVERGYDTEACGASDAGAAGRIRYGVAFAGKDVAVVGARE